MLDRIIQFSIRNKLIIGLFTLGLIIWGSISLTRLPIDAVPDITNNQVQIITSSPSLAAQEVERLITFPIETNMATIPDIEEIRSFSRFGLSVVTIVFKEQTDIYWARQQIAERLSQAAKEIPPGSGDPYLAPISTGLGEIYQYTLQADPGYEDRFSLMELRTIQDWIVRRRLLGTPGVADVSSFGGYLKQYEVAIDPDRLRAMNVTLSELFGALEKNNQNTGGAYIEKQPNAYFIRSSGLINDLKDIEKIVVRVNPNGMPVLVQDVATVQLGHATRYGAITRNGAGEAVGAVVMMLKDENGAQVIKRVKARIAQIEEALPEGVSIKPFIDRTTLVDKAIGTVSKNLIEGALIVIFILVLFLGNVRAGLVVASVIPLAMLFAISMMNIFGVSGNLMSLGAIDFGLIVDGAVIIVESVVHRIAGSKLRYAGVARLNQQQMDEEVYNASSKIRTSAAFGEIIILIVYLPLLTLVGVEGKMFRPMAMTVSFAILGAFILSLTYVPMMSALFLDKRTEHRHNFSDRMMEFFQRHYQPVIAWALKSRKSVLLVAVTLFAFSLFVFSRMGAEFIPTLDEGDFAIGTMVMTGSSLTESVETSNKAAKILMDEFPEVVEVVGKTGSGEIPTDPMPIEATDMIVVLKDRKEWTSARTREELAAKMNDALSVLPGARFSFQQPIQMRFNELMTGSKQDVVLKIYGDDLDELSRQADRVGALVNTVAGAADLYVEKVTGLPQIVVELDRDAIARYGLDVETINNVINTAFAGQPAGLVYEGERRFDLVVRLASDYRKDITDVKSLYISTPTGQQVPITQVADIRLVPGPVQIQRDDTKRRITIAFNVRGRDVESIVDEIREKVAQSISLPSGYYMTYGGQFENLIEARQRLAVAVPLALGLIFALLYFTFHSVKQSALIFMAIPMSAIGGVFALYLRDMPFSISAGVGFIALFGVAVLNGIVLLAEFNRLKASGVADLDERVHRGTQTRLRPVLMTALVASLGFLPMALSTSAGAEVQRPLATVVIGGLFTATLLTLIVLPVLYTYFENGFKKRNGAAGAVILFLGMLMLPAANGARAQEVPQQYTLERAIEETLQNHPALRADTYRIASGRALKRTAFDPDKMDVEMQYGKYNSFENDLSFTLSQRFSFPTVYTAQAKLLAEQLTGLELERAVTANELTANVKAVWYQLAYLDEVRRLLLRQDTIYSAFARAADIRFRTGETNRLEQVTAETQLMEVRNLLMQNRADYRNWYRQLQVLVNTSDTLVLNIGRLEARPLTLQLDTAALSRNPGLAQSRQQIAVAGQRQRVEKSLLLPDLMVGYLNQSLIGSPLVNGSTAAMGNRFSAVQAGISIPLFFGAQTARTRAAAEVRLAAEADYAAAENALQATYSRQLQEYRKLTDTRAYYERRALPQAEAILENADKGFREGAIGYVEYVQGVQRAIDIKSGYLDALNQYNQAVINLEFIFGQSQ
ncbi:CusA/CzcA family heavy metal efflux RND transporter [Parapedobacter lycopersici]|uniref:CusA/CzcA family heavy metal efflux RND transporter n=1 Tax=Parapedobacter lycopersici TaxID=1864939 RepID=UPI00333EDB1F